MSKQLDLSLANLIKIKKAPVDVCLLMDDIKEMIKRGNFSFREGRGSDVIVKIALPYVSLADDIFKDRSVAEAIEIGLKDLNEEASEVHVRAHSVVTNSLNSLPTVIVVEFVYKQNSTFASTTKNSMLHSAMTQFNN